MGDRTPFDFIEVQFSIKENEVRKIMRANLKRSFSSYGEKRVKGRKTKHRGTSESKKIQI